MQIYINIEICDFLCDQTVHKGLRFRCGFVDFPTGLRIHSPNQGVTSLFPKSEKGLPEAALFYRRPAYLSGGCLHCAYHPDCETGVSFFHYF